MIFGIDLVLKVIFIKLVMLDVSVGIVLLTASEVIFRVPINAKLRPLSIRLSI
jgi:hypothetical protein